MIIYLSLKKLLALSHCMEKPGVRHICGNNVMSRKSPNKFTKL